MSEIKLRSRKGILFVVSAASGAGKTSLVRRLIKELDDVTVSISHTTRDPRPGETEGIHYHFIDQAEFERMQSEGEFLESATVFNNHYGTSKHWVLQTLEKGEDVILELDWQGARAVRAAFDDVVSIFIMPPSLEELQARLEGRGQDSDEVIQFRLECAQRENIHYDEYDYLIFNDDFDTAFSELSAIVFAERLRLPAQICRYREAIEKLCGEAPKID